MKRLKEAGEAAHLVCLLSGCPCCMLLGLPSSILLTCLIALGILLHKCHLPQRGATANVRYGTLCSFPNKELSDTRGNFALCSLISSSYAELLPLYREERAMS